MIVQSYPPKREEDGSVTFVLSSADSDSLYEKYKDRIGKSDVKATLEITYWQIKPHPSGQGTQVT